MIPKEIPINQEPFSKTLHHYANLLNSDLTPITNEIGKIYRKHRNPTFLSNYFFLSPFSSNLFLPNFSLGKKSLIKRN